METIMENALKDITAVLEKAQAELEDFRFPEDDSESVVRLVMFTQAIQMAIYAVKASVATAKNL